MPLGVMEHWRSPGNPGQAATSRKVFSFSILSPPSAPLPPPLNTAQVIGPDSTQGAHSYLQAAEVTTKFNLGPPSVLPDMLSLSPYQNEGQDCLDTFQCQAQQPTIFWCGLPSSDTLIVVPPTCLGALASAIAWPRAGEGSSRALSSSCGMMQCPAVPAR